MYFFFFVILDAAIFKEFWNWIVSPRDRGNFIKARTSSFNGIPSPQDAEAFALQKSLEWIQLLQLSNVIFETDCKMITHHLGSDRNGHSDFNFIFFIVRCGLWDILF